jgi:DNA-binding response OmpR family regulator
MIKANRILIVDDEPNVRLGFRTALETNNYAVQEAGDGQEALEHLGRGAASLVLLDLKMPGLGGMETLRRLRDAGNAVPVVIVTAHGTIPDSVEAMKLGAIDFLSKPITPMELRRVVREVIERHARPEREPGPEPIVPQPGHPTIVTIGPAAVDLTPAKRALNDRDFDRAEDLLETALETFPFCAEALTLVGVLRESRGQDHAAYQAYRAALESDPHYGPARDNMRRYCERFGLDFHNKAINPGAA